MLDQIIYWWSQHYLKAKSLLLILSQSISLMSSLEIDKPSNIMFLVCLYRLNFSGESQNLFKCTKLKLASEHQSHFFWQYDSGLDFLKAFSFLTQKERKLQPKYHFLYKNWLYLHHNKKGGFLFDSQLAYICKLLKVVPNVLPKSLILLLLQFIFLQLNLPMLSNSHVYFW